MKKPAPVCRFSAPASARHSCYVLSRAGICRRKRPTFTEVQFVAGPSGATKRKVDDGEVGETAGKLTIASAGGTTLYDPPFLASPSEFETRRLTVCSENSRLRSARSAWPPAA